ncbi:MAG: SGNH/GDSL hydrolase family protein [Thiothrix sp.]|uniref:SGNH/GDSL hydrolase family protein n=1 Tax=Thiothrix sp. TaxID=1032 RepID=UPI0026389BA6|nr:SGNH/GDSL hydrolase family protein [Thiothrix sp.]MDD5392552.1 SGNH/GDSL hydrolase family protein [Thiothrix sp.]
MADMDMRKPLSRRKEWLFRAISFLFGLSIVLGGLEIVLRFLPVSGVYTALPVNATNPLMRYPPYSTHQYSSGWNFAIAQQKQANNDGFYSDYDYVQTTKPLMAVIGDSFIEAEQIPNKDTVQALLNAGLRGEGRVYGFGIQGSPLSQYLIFADHARREYQPKAMTFTIIANDFDQSLMEYGKDILSGMYLFSDTSEQARLELLDYPGSYRSGLRGFLKNAALVRYLYANVGLNPKQIKAWFDHPDTPPVHFGGIGAATDAKRLTNSKRAVELFFQHLPKKTGLPTEKILFVVDGIREVNNETDWKAAQQSYFGQMREYFMQAARQRGYEVVDMHPTFYQAQQAGKKVDFVPQDWHWNSVGHRLVADAVKQTRVYQQTFSQ